jgi:hypothetical protein
LKTRLYLFLRTATVIIIPLSYEVYDSNRKYGYARVTFSSVKLDLQQNVYFKYSESYDYSSVIKANEDKVLKTDSAAKENPKMKRPQSIVYELYIYSYDYFLSKDYVSKDDDGNITIDFTQLKEDKDLTEITKHEILQQQYSYNFGKI